MENNFTQLRKLISGGFKAKEDIKSCLELLQQIELDYASINLKSKFYDELQIFKPDEQEPSLINTIDFGTGKLHYYIEPGSSAYITDIMTNLNEHRTTALTVIASILKPKMF